MRSFGLLVSVLGLSLAAGCDRETHVVEGPEICEYECQGNECPGLLARDLIDLHRVASDNGDLYWTLADSLYRRDATGVLENVAAGVGWADGLAIAGTPGGVSARAAVSHARRPRTRRRV
jgi:hypothetical protein